MNYKIPYPLSRCRFMFPFRTVVRLNGTGKYYLLTFIYAFSGKKVVDTLVSIAGPYGEAQSCFIEEHPTAAINRDDLAEWALDMLDEGQLSRA